VSIQRLSPIRALTRTLDERGSANLLGFIMVLGILIPAFFIFMFFSTAKTSRVNFDAQVINTAKAAVSATYTNPEGALRVDCAQAQVAATDAYELFRPFNVDQFGARTIDLSHTPSVVVTCVELPDGTGSISASVQVVDEYRGGLVTAGYFPSWSFTGNATAALVVAE
jgi:hypothetical protein